MFQISKGLYSKRMDFRLGAEPRATGVYIVVNEDCEMVKATTPKIHSRRVYSKRMDFRLI